MGSKMLIRALLLSLACASAYGVLTPLSAAADDNDCALYLSGPGRTSAYDYRLNLLKGNFGYEGQHTCITYEAVNHAYHEARNRIVVSQPKGEWKPEDYASAGELILDISINLARKYGLTYEEIEKGLPLIDTSRTLIREVCPPVFSHVECRAGKYRRLDGLCNNLQHPTWGATNAPFQRLIGPLFSDGINAPRISHTGRELPLSRVVSRTMHPDDGFHDHAGTVMVIAWGQFMDHDYTLTGTPLDPINRNDPEECCKRPLHLKHPYCNEIRIPDDDYFYRLFGVKCIDFVRGFPSPRPGCRLGSRVPFNTLTGSIDGNTVYGVTDKFSRKLRTGYGGLLRMNPVFKEYGLKDLLPLKLDIPDEGCTRPNKNMYCFEAGEIRVNEQLVLTVMHTLMAREHNRVAKGLAAVNPHWDDETLFQEARRINIAEIQHITYNEFLPILLGKDVMEKFGLVVEKQNYWDGYDPTVNPDVIASFASAAYRFGHSLLPTAVERWSKAHKFIASKRLSDLIRRPYDLYRAGVLDEYVMGLMNQVAQAMDDSITQEVTNHLFKKVGARFGMDLVSFNMQRGREFGIPGYMEFRKFCGLSGADTFQDLFGTMSNETVRKYETIFEHPIDVDLWSGGVSERPLPGSMLGPTFACIIATQFSYSRRGDRFWYELPNQPSSFTPEQLQEVRKSRLARVICDNTDIIDTVQLYPMVLPDHELNPRVPCRSGIIPTIDFSKWAEPAPFHGPAKQFFLYVVKCTAPVAIPTQAIVMTDAYIPPKNVTYCQDDTNTTIEATSEVTNQKNHTICEPQTAIVQDCGCNETADAIEQASTITVNNNTSNSDPTEIEKEEASANTSDTVLKYVYKKDETVNTKEKSAGHIKNRIKRSANSNREETYKERAPLIVNYTTNHEPGPWKENHERLIANVIKSAELADFNIETLHDNDKNLGNKKNLIEKQNYDGENTGKKPESRIIVENDSDEDRNIKKHNDENNSREENSNEDENESGDRLNSNERSDSRQSDAPRSSSGSSESIDNRYQNKEPYRESKDSSSDTEENSDPGSYENNENEKYKEKADSSEGNDKSEEKPSSRVKDKSDKSHRENHSDRESAESSSSEESSKSQNEEYSAHPNSQRIKSTSDEDNLSSRNSNESNEHSNKHDTAPIKPNYDDEEEEEIIAIMTKKSRSNHSATAQPSPIKLQDIDLDDFNSYERIQVNDKGVVEPIKDTHSNYNDDSDKERKLDSSEYSQSVESKENSSSDENYDKLKTVKVNVGEVKPVIEINSDGVEKNSANSNEAVTTVPENEADVSLETLLGVKDSDEKSNKIIVPQELGKENGDVKQQFERIPLDYKHSKKDKDAVPTPTPIEVPKNNEEKLQNEGTLDELSPREEKLDENLNIKFEDIVLDLPEIKLPDDILSYAYEGNEDRDNENNRALHYDDDDRPQKQRSGKNSNEEDDSEEDTYDDHIPYNYYGQRENNKKKNQKQKAEAEDDEEEDLYEKFVRERFGKKSSFGHRSAKLRDSTPGFGDPNLFRKLRHIAKKTEDIEKEALKSGDPNAGYMWTLEYGQKL